jgi:dTDP-4-dehydrorhamnose reductase
MKVVVFGSNGMLGNYLCSILSKTKEVIKLSRKDFDISKFTCQSLDIFLKELNLDKKSVIVNCAGIIPQSKNEYIRDYIKINSLFPVCLSMICEFNDWNFIHITTDCVFSGSMGNYDENSKHDETNIYGITKSLGEIGYGTIIRTSIIGEEIINKRSLLEWVKSNKNGSVDGYDNHFWNGVTCLQLSMIINQIIDENLYWQGIYHLFSPNQVSKYELIKMINDIYDLNIQINKINKNYCNKTLTSIFDTHFEVPEIYSQLKTLKEIKEIEK